MIIDLLRQGGVHGSIALVIALFIADEHIKGLLFLRYRQNAALYLRNYLAVFFILTTGYGICVFQCCLVVHILQKTIKAGSVAGGQIFSTCRVLDIFNAKAAKRTAPVRLSIGLVFLNDALIDQKRLVKLTNSAEVVATVEGSSPLFIIHFGQGHGRTAVFTGAATLVSRYFHVSAAHLALDDGHLISSSILCFLYFHAIDCKSQAHFYDFISGTTGFLRDEIEFLYQFTGQTG